MQGARGRDSGMTVWQENLGTRVGRREPWAQWWCWGLLVLDGIRSGRRCPGQEWLPGPRRREFSLGDKEGQCFLWVRSKEGNQETKLYAVGEEGVGVLGVLREGGGEPSLTSAKSRITIQCIFQAAISLRVKRLQIIIAVGMPVGKLSQANQDLSLVLERQFKLLLFLQEALLGNCSPHELALFLAL